MFRDSYFPCFAEKISKLPSVPPRTANPTKLGFHWIRGIPTRVWTRNSLSQSPLRKSSPKKSARVRDGKNSSWLSFCRRREPTYRTWKLASTPSSRYASPSLLEKRKIQCIMKQLVTDSHQRSDFRESLLNCRRLESRTLQNLSN